MKTIRVLICEDHPGIRRRLRELLSSEEDIFVIGEASNGYEALQYVEQLLPDVLLLDIEMPQMNGLLVSKVLRANQSQVKVIILSAYNDPEWINSALEYGAGGYLIKDDAPALLAKAVRGIANNQTGWFSLRVEDILRKNQGSEKTSPPDK